MTQLDPKAAGARHVHIRRCLGNFASGNDHRCHPTHHPGGYDVGFAMMNLNVHQPFATFEEAREFALMFAAQLGRIIKKDREGDEKTGQALETLKEVDVFGGRAAYATAEHYLKYHLKTCGTGHIIGGLRKCRYGWLARWDTKTAWHRWGGKRGWYAWEGKSKPEGQKRMLLVVPPTGTIYNLDVADFLEERFLGLNAAHPDVEPVYTIDPDYDTLVNAGVEDWRAECVLGLISAHIEVAWSAFKHGDFHPDFEEAARVIIERCATAAGVTLTP